MIGVDVSKPTMAVTWWDAAARTARWEASGPNDPAGVARLLDQTPTDEPLVLEPTGRSGRALVDAARAQGRPLLLAPPRRAKAFLAAVQPRAKTDRLDSRGLALDGASAALTPYPVKPPDTEELAQLLAARKGISRAALRLALQRRELPAAAAALDAALQVLREQLAELDRPIAARAAPMPEAAALDRVPGIGPVVAAALAPRLRAKV
jgi:transposase